MSQLFSNELLFLTLSIFFHSFLVKKDRLVLRLIPAPEIVDVCKTLILLVKELGLVRYPTQELFVGFLFLMLQGFRDDHSVLVRVLGLGLGPIYNYRLLGQIVGFNTSLDFLFYYFDGSGRQLIAVLLKVILEFICDGFWRVFDEVIGELDIGHATLHHDLDPEV